jgi:hypothetical protein
VPTFTQDELRERRQHWLHVTYDDRFDLAAEVAAIVGPLSGAVSRLPRPAALHRDVNDVADAVHKLVSAVIGMLRRIQTSRLRRVRPHGAAGGRSRATTT